MANRFRRTRRGKIYAAKSFRFGHGTASDQLQINMHPGLERRVFLTEIRRQNLSFASNSHLCGFIAFLKIGDSRIRYPRGFAAQVAHTFRLSHKKMQQLQDLAQQCHLSFYLALSLTRLR